jgi:hypothetical protein
MDLDARETLANEGLVLAMVDVIRQSPGNEVHVPQMSHARVPYLAAAQSCLMKHPVIRQWLCHALWRWVLSM